MYFDFESSKNYASAALIRYNHNKIIQCCIKNIKESRKSNIDNMGSHTWVCYV